MNTASGIHVLARAVIVLGDQVLLARQIGARNTFLPGGHVEPGESLPVCLAREIAEEIGMEAEVGRYLGAVEAGWRDAAGDHFEINHLFEAALRGAAPGEPVRSREPHLEFVWSRRAELAANNLLPAPLVGLLSRWDPADERAWWATAL